MLWKYNLNFTGFIEAPNSVSAARQMLIDRITDDPASFISRIEPAEASSCTFVELGKKVIGLH